LASLSADANAEELRVHGTAGLARAITEPQSSEFGFGAAGSLALELPLARAVGIQLEAGGLVLASGDAPNDPRFAARDAGTLGTAMAGFRFRPYAAKRRGGLWFDVNGGVGATGNLVRPVLGAHVGWDFRLNDSRVELGPMVGYAHIFQSNDALRPEDANLLIAGIHIGLGEREKKAEAPTDRDGDGVYDYEDACPDVPGLRTTDPRTNGCPRPDRDRDTIYDDEDACPDEPGIRTDDPKTNGCPRRDRDKDGVFDDEDACPDEPGIRTDDPKTNGCPRPDRDNDGVFDDEDACPDVPGIRTDDPKTNGCPASSGPVRVFGDRILLDDVILFDLDSPRVRRASWPLVQKIADFINANPDIIEIDIEGHADQTGSEQHNLRLSRARAESVKKLLVKYGVDDSRVTTAGLGKSRPKLAGMSEEERRENRRVEFIIVRARAATRPAPTSSPLPPQGVESR
jgi:outer membrane protein OmpA-like peptidoglycan-associated protein